MPSSSRSSSAQQDATEAFFEDMAGRGHDPRLHDADGTLRLDLTDGAAVAHYFVSAHKGEVRVSRRSSRADAVVCTDRATFDGMAKGEVNATAALLRGVVDVDGDLGIVTSFIRLFPGPPSSRRAHLERQERQPTKEKEPSP